MFKYYLYAAFISGILFTTPIAILVYKLEKKLKNEAAFYTPLVSTLVFTIVFLYSLANKITYIGEFFGYGY